MTGSQSALQLEATDISIIEDDLMRADVAALIRLHLDEVRQWSPACKIHAMPIERLREPDVQFYSAWHDGRLSGIGAIKHLAPEHCEIKSMRAAPEFRGRGIGKAILLHLIETARSRGYKRVSLETGNTEPFAAARALYAAHGFSECPPFGNYLADGFSMCMTKLL